ncbi:helicase [Aureococcus anophagefferens]|nr:helicase [Aureococcus anophagefferens]
MTDSFTFNFVASGAAAPRSAPKKETKKERKARAQGARGQGVGERAADDHDQEGRRHRQESGARGARGRTRPRRSTSGASGEAAAGPPSRKKRHAWTPSQEFSAFHLSPAELTRPRGDAAAPAAPRPSQRRGAGARGVRRPATTTGSRPSARRRAAPRRPGIGKTHGGADPALWRSGRKRALLVAPTGSGKTLAYALPVLEALAARKKGRGDGAGCLVLAPTRELCLQIADVVEVVARKYDVSIVPRDHGGGANRDIIRRLGAKTYVTVLVTATITAKLADLAKAHLGRDHALVEVAKRETAPGAVETIAMPETLAQSYAICTLKLRLGALAAMLRDHPHAKTLVFVSTCASAEFHADLLNRPECRRLWEGATKAPRVAGRLHGNMKRDERRGAYVEFCRSGAAVLVATDVAAA